MNTPVTDNFVGKKGLLLHNRGAFIQRCNCKYNNFSHKTCLLPFVVNDWFNQLSILVEIRYLSSG
jgi:hypothetical protein